MNTRKSTRKTTASSPTVNNQKEEEDDEIQIVSVKRAKTVHPPIPTTMQPETIKITSPVVATAAPVIQSNAKVNKNAKAEAALKKFSTGKVTSTSKRLSKELQDMIKDPPQGCT